MRTGTKVWTVASLALALAVSVSPASAGKIAIGDPAPMTGIEMTSVDGKTVSIADVTGEKGTLVVFTCNHCPFVKAWESRTIALGNEFQAKGVGVIAINSNDPTRFSGDSLEEMKKRAAEKGMSYPYVVDETSDIARAFGATRTPEVFLFDAEGSLVYHGTIDDNAQHPDKVERRYLRDALEAVAAGNEVAVKETKALGCSIKFRPAGS